MKIRLITLILGICALAPQLSIAINVDIYNDSKEQLQVRGRFTDRDNNFYWSDWVNLIDHVDIKSANIDDSFYGIALLPAQIVNTDVNPDKNTRGIIYQLSEFHSDSGRTFTKLSTDTRITIRDAKIEVSSNLHPENELTPQEGDYWTGDYARY